MCSRLNTITYGVTYIELNKTFNFFVYLYFYATFEQQILWLFNNLSISAQLRLSRLPITEQPA